MDAFWVKLQSSFYKTFQICGWVTDWKNKAQFTAAKTLWDNTRDAKQQDINSLIISWHETHPLNSGGTMLWGCCFFIKTGKLLRVARKTDGAKILG